MAAVLGDDARRRRRFDVGAGVGRRHVGVGQSAAGGAPLLCPAAEEKNPPIRITANKKKKTPNTKKKLGQWRAALLRSLEPPRDGATIWKPVLPGWPAFSEIAQLPDSIRSRPKLVLIDNRLMSRRLLLLLLLLLHG